MRNRWYDPHTARFITSDPFWYVGNMTHWDGSGLSIESGLTIQNSGIFSHGITQTRRVFEQAISSWEAVTGSTQTIFANNGNGGGTPNLAGIRQLSNLYAFVMNNPIMFTDPSGLGATAGTLNFREILEVLKAAVAPFSGAAALNPVILAAMATGLVSLSIQNNVFFAVDNFNFQGMRSITIADAAFRVLRGQDVWTAFGPVARAFATVMSGGQTPVGPQIHGHGQAGFFQHYHRNPRTPRGTERDAHIFFGTPST